MATSGSRCGALPECASMPMVVVAVVTVVVVAAVAVVVVAAVPMSRLLRRLKVTSNSHLMCACGPWAPAGLWLALHRT